tara:strand:- start:1374 stop:2240 length:867 start_codon:yes stop_codon:yes gene_type:complete
MSEEITQDAGPQEVAEAVAAEPVVQEPIAQQEVAQPVSEGNWLSSLDETYQQDPLINKFASANELAKSHISAQRMIGADKVVIPGQSATPDEWRAVYQKLGAPQDPASYELEQTDVFDETSFDAFKNKAYELGLSNQQAKEIAGLYADQVNTGRQVLEQRAEEVRFSGEQELRQQFGDHFDQRLEMARSASQTVMNEDDLKIFSEVQLADGRLLGDHPAIVRAFTKVAELLGEDNLVGETTEMVMSSQDAKQRYNEVVQQGSPYWDKFHVDHQNYIDEALHLRSYFTG